MSDAGLHHLDRTRLRDQVASAIRDMVLTRQLQAGERIVQTEWAARLGVSRMPVRDAINQLCAEGILVVDDRAGSAVVADIRLDDLKDSYVVNATVLGLVARRAAERITTDDLERLQALHDRMREVVVADDRDAAAALNRQFHKLINAAAASPRLSAIVRVADISIPHSTYGVQDWPSRSLEEHAAILQAFRARNAQLASRLMRRHVESGSELMLASIERRDTSVSGRSRKQRPL